MSKELVIGSNRHETKVAVLEDDQLVELYFQRANEYSLAGSIHKGRVTRVLPGMQSAFVDLGLERDTFLYVSDFFEEHDEDIDTVSDEKPERSRDDRGQRRDRGAERGSDRGARPPERQLAAVVAPAPEPERYVAPPALIGDLEDDFDEPEEIAAPITTAPVTISGEVRAADSQPRPANNEPRRNNNDDRGGDRRGRRSRRRRGRGGRGIPDNKYAQPGTADAAPSTDRAEQPAERYPERRHSEPEVEERIFAPGVTDVIILPGESLAKYRGRPEAVSEPVPEPVTPTLPVLEMAAEEEAESEYDAEQLENQEEIDEEADSLELADKVFSHREPEAFELDEEEKIAEVRRDHPAPEPLEAVIEIPPSVDEIQELRQEHLQEHLDDISWSPERRAAEELFSKVVPIREDEPELLAEHLHHSEPLSQAEAFEAEVEELDATGSIASVHDLAPEIEEALESGDFEANLPETTDSTQAVQTASVRDQGGRSPHRSSRRMRRRRGGNRGGSDGPSNAPAVATASAAAGSAPALEPVEPRAELVEERVTERPERPDRGDRVMPSISDLLKAGQEIIVQIAKEPLGQKGARITSHIALPGRYVVFMPSVNHLGVSRKVSSDEERQRSEAHILQAHRVGTTGGFIVRTAGEGVPEEEIAADMNFLYTLWLDIRQKAEKKPAPVAASLRSGRRAAHSPRSDHGRLQSHLGGQRRTL